ncbi:hypothetical protein JTB14_030975 [Gonioctena quinquepunctata]|nr:hypothetical protein JTB14_030975 [Gonioctena quinquepunctata]
MSSNIYKSGFKLPLSKLGLTNGSVPVMIHPSHWQKIFARLNHNLRQAGHLESLQYVILAAVEDISDGGTQVRFQGCTLRPGRLLVTCDGQESASWLEGVINTLQPWEWAFLKCVTGDQLPRPHICIAFIPDEGSRRLSPSRSSQD